MPLNPDARLALNELLLSLYGATPSARQSLLALVERLPHGERVSYEVPSPEYLEPQDLIWRLIRWMENAGLINQEFFDALARHKPNQTVEIRDVQRLIQRLVLFLAATPDGAAPLEVDKECAEVIAAIRGVFGNRAWALLPFTDITLDAWIEKIALYKPDVLHFSGHGTIWGLPVVEGDEPLVLEPLVEQIRGSRIRGVVLNACHSGRLARSLVEQTGVSWAIGTSKAVNDAVAVQFARGFYQGLGLGEEPAVAFARGKAACKWHTLVGDDVLEFYRKP